MRSAREEYGRDVVYLDAINKTTDYALPLFFLVIKTPSTYLVVGTFIVQFETAECIEEALMMFRTWCSQFNPKFWMVDYCLAEINAIRAIFPESSIAMCDFHREQAWERWCKRKVNGVQEQGVVLTSLRSLAKAATEQEYMLLVEELEAAPFRKAKPKLQQYIKQHWLSIKECWVTFYRLDLHVTTNNGVENQNRLLKGYYLKNHCGRKSLSGLVQILLDKFLLEKQNEFLRNDMTFTSAYRAYHTYIPEFLHDRPPAVVKHIIQRLLAAEDFNKNNIQMLEKAGTFHVHSQTTASAFYTVDFSQPHCNCMDFRKTQLPCKHFCAVFLQYKD
ncbi:uncharacterized protein LOC135384336 [Ornithodoros turicata]|uniref:uncharacterized protein LOC135384336 n=1 Tax=Ornithodoros turicata TaxID=34597 RepID=UPI0031390CF1